MQVNTEAAVIKVGEFEVTTNLKTTTIKGPDFSFEIKSKAITMVINAIKTELTFGSSRKKVKIDG